MPYLLIQLFKTYTNNDISIIYPLQLQKTQDLLNIQDKRPAREC